MAVTALDSPARQGIGPGRAEHAEYPAVAQSVRDARNCVVDFALAHGATQRRSEDICLAVSEAASNVVRHAYPSPDTGAFRIHAEADRAQLHVRIEDDGCGLNAPAVDPGFGAGVMLMSAVSRRARFRERPCGGSSVELSFDLL